MDNNVNNETNNIDESITVKEIVEPVDNNPVQEIENPSLDAVKEISEPIVKEVVPEDSEMTSPKAIEPVVEEVSNDTTVTNPSNSDSNNNLEFQSINDMLLKTNAVNQGAINGKLDVPSIDEVMIQNKIKTENINVNENVNNSVNNMSNQNAIPKQNTPFVIDTRLEKNKKQPKKYYDYEMFQNSIVDRFEDSKPPKKAKRIVCLIISIINILIPFPLAISFGLGYMLLGAVAGNRTTYYLVLAGCIIYALFSIIFLFVSIWNMVKYNRILRIIFFGLVITTIIANIIVYSQASKNIDNLKNTIKNISPGNFNIELNNE